MLYWWGARNLHSELFVFTITYVKRNTNMSCQSSFWDQGPVSVANIKEALRGQSKADFGSKMNIALKEASESDYWIELLGESGKIMNDGAVSLLEDCRELIILPTAIVKSTFKN